MSTQDQFERATIGALVVFATSVGCLSLVGILLLLTELAADTATAIGAATPAGVGISLAIRKGK